MGLPRREWIQRRNLRNPRRPVEQVRQRHRPNPKPRLLEKVASRNELECFRLIHRSLCSCGMGGPPMRFGNTGGPPVPLTDLLLITAASRHISVLVTIVQAANSFTLTSTGRAVSPITFFAAASS